MTIDEAIDSEKRIQKIKELEDKVTGIKSTNPQYHKQIAEWLEELKAKRNIGECAYKQGYNKGIDDYNKILKQRSIKMGRKVSTNFLYKIVYHKTVGTNEIDRIAEQLKGGVKNDN